MIRMIGTRLLVPRGDSGIFSLPNKKLYSAEDIAIFSVKDILTQETVIEKYIDASSACLVVELTHKDTAPLHAGKYIWDIKIYTRPQFDEDGVFVDALEADSYYSAYEQPLLIIKEVAKSNV